MYIIKEHISLFRKEVMNKLLSLTDEIGDEITAVDNTDAPYINNGTLDRMYVNKSISGTTILFEYSDSYDNNTAYAETICIETLIEIYEWLFKNKETLKEDCINNAIGLLGDVYDDIFYDPATQSDDRGQTFKIDDFNITLGEMQIVGVEDNGDWFALLDKDGVKYWDSILPGDRLRIAQEIFNKYYDNKNSGGICIV
jgi:hypothetical protein